MKYYSNFIITVEGTFSPFCPTPVPYQGYRNLGDAVHSARQVAKDLTAKGGFDGKAVTVWDTQQSLYAKIIEL